MAAIVMCKCCRRGFTCADNVIWLGDGQRHAASFFRVEVCRARLYWQVGGRVVTQTHRRERNGARYKPIHRKTILFMRTFGFREMELWKKAAIFRATILNFIRGIKLEL
jgi:hypothetical protein